MAMDKMIQRILSIILLTPVAMAQMDSVKPDMSFTDNNDRFDLTGMINAHKRMFRNTPVLDEADGDEGVASDADYRRTLYNKKMPHLLKNKVYVTRKDDVDFAYDPDNLPTIGRAGSDNMVDLDFQENLKLFKMGIPKARKRNVPHDDHKKEYDVLMQNVVPIVLKVDGFLKPPLKELPRLYALQGRRLILKTT